MGLVAEHRSGSYTGWTQEIEGAEIVVGRGEGCRLRFAADDDAVSTQHAELKLYADGYYYITDLGSRNGTFANGAPVRGAVRLEPGTILRFGAQGPEVLITYAPTPWAP